MANIPALAGYQLATGAAAAAKFGASDVLTDPNGKVLATGGGALVILDTPFVVLDQSNNKYNGAAQGVTWNYTSDAAFNGLLDLSGTSLPSNVTTVYLLAITMLWNTIGGLARAITVYGAKTWAQLPLTSAAPQTSPYTISHTGGGSAGAYYDSSSASKLVQCSAGNIVALSAYGNNGTIGGGNGHYWTIHVIGYIP